MLTEAIFIILHLTLFSQLINDLVSFERLSFKEKQQNISVFFLFSTFFYSSFYLHSLIELYFFSYKYYIFSHYSLLVIILICFLLFVVFTEKTKSILFISSLLFSPLLFFLIFGSEDFTFFDYSFKGFNLLKPQNPILTLIFSLLLLPRDSKVKWFLFLLVITLLKTYSNHKIAEFKKFQNNSIYSKYSPSEFFLNDDYLLCEEEEGIYSYIRSTEIDEPIYKFTLKPLRHLPLKDRQPIQDLIVNFEFPIVIKEENTIYIYDLYRTYRGRTLKVSYDFKKEEIKVEGPLF
jgi:hypothetical protein